MRQQSEKKKKHIFHKKKDADQIVRIEELEKILSEDSDDVDVDAIVSMYMPHRKARKDRKSVV